MINVTINMNLDDYNMVKKLLENAYENTCTQKGEEIDRNKIEWANSQINQVLCLLGAP